MTAPAGDDVPGLYLDAREVAASFEPVGVIDMDLQTPARVEGAADYDSSAARRADAIAGGAVDVDPLMEAVLRLVFAEGRSTRVLSSARGGGYRLPARPGAKAGEAARARGWLLSAVRHLDDRADEVLDHAADREIAGRFGSQDLLL
jgi:hypothetical protein